MLKPLEAISLREVVEGRGLYRVRVLERELLQALRLTPMFQDPNPSIDYFRSITHEPKMWGGERHVEVEALANPR
jgi:hypothetical protein